MRALLLAGLWIHLTCSVLLVGGFSMSLLAGQPRDPGGRRWDATLATWARHLALVAIGAGVVWLLARTAIFENRPGAALEPRAVVHALLDTWPGLVWLARQGLLVILAAFLALRADVADRRDWIGGRAESLALATAALALMSASSHAAAITPRTLSAVAADAVHGGRRDLGGRPPRSRPPAACRRQHG